MVDRALTLNPSFARGWHIGGILWMMAGRPDLTIERVEVSLRLIISPRARSGWAAGVIGAVHLLSSRFDQAFPMLLLAIQEDPSYTNPYRYLAAYYAYMGRLDKGAKSLARLRSITPAVLPDASYLRRPEHRNLFLSGLRMAAGEET